MAADKTGTGELNLSGSTLVALVRAVHEKGADFRMVAKGGSMYPSIHNGDVITISPFRDLAPYPGEVVAFTRPGTEKLIVHRIARKMTDAYLITGDNTVEPDGIIPAAYLLGVVTRVERGDKILFWPDRLNHRLLARLYFSTYPALARWSRPAVTRLYGLVVKVIPSGHEDH